MPENYILKAFRDFVTAPAQKQPKYYFRIQNGSQIRISHSERPIQWEILPENYILKAFL